MNASADFKVESLGLLIMDETVKQTGLLAEVQCSLMNGRQVRGLKLHIRRGESFFVNWEPAEISVADPTSLEFEPLSHNEFRQVWYSLKPLMATALQSAYPEIPDIEQHLTSSNGPVPKPSSLLPLNPKLLGTGVFTLRHVAEDIFLTPASYPVRFTGVTPVDNENEEDPDDEIFCTSEDQLIRIVQGGAELTPCYTIRRVACPPKGPMEQAAEIRFAKPDYSLGRDPGECTWMPVLERIRIALPVSADSPAGWAGEVVCTLFDGRVMSGMRIIRGPSKQYEFHVNTPLLIWPGRLDPAPSPAPNSLLNTVRGMTMFILPQLLRIAG